MLVMNQKIERVFSLGQQSKFQKLQLEVAALEEQVENAMKEQMALVNDYKSLSPIPLVYVNDQSAKTGVRLAQDNAN